jgi:hypothetical protein
MGASLARLRKLALTRGPFCGDVTPNPTNDVENTALTLSRGVNAPLPTSSGSSAILATVWHHLI